MPAVSVVIPSYRGGKFLRHSVESVHAQTFEDWEVVVVLDGCEEDVSDLERLDKRVRVVRQRNRGEAIARNVGIANAQSELIALLDDDDRMLPDRLRAQVEAMKDEDIGLCHTQYQVIDKEGTVIAPGLSRESQYDDFLRTNGKILISTTMTRKSIIQAVGGFNPLLPIGTDLDLIYRVARESRLRFLPEVLTEYRIHSNNIWANSSSSRGGEVKSILIQHGMLAEARSERENMRAIREGIKHVLPSRAQFALQRAVTARENHEYRTMLLAVGQAMVISPTVVPRLLIRGLKQQK
jgi:glycosyltransferase involved in cell wall biosynthesis